MSSINGHRCAAIFTPGWVAAIVGILGATFWLMLFAYKHIDYHHGLWFQFEFQGDDALRFAPFDGGAGRCRVRLAGPLRPPRRRIPVGSQDNARELKPYLHRAGDASATRPCCSAIPEVNDIAVPGQLSGLSRHRSVEHSRFR